MTPYTPIQFVPTHEKMLLAEHRPHNGTIMAKLPDQRFETVIIAPVHHFTTQQNLPVV